MFGVIVTNVTKRKRWTTRLDGLEAKTSFLCVAKRLGFANQQEGDVQFVSFFPSRTEISKTTNATDVSPQQLHKKLRDCASASLVGSERAGPEELQQRMVLMKFQGEWVAQTEQGEAFIAGLGDLFEDCTDSGYLMKVLMMAKLLVQSP